MKYVVYTLGCKVNQYESDSIITQLKLQGHDVSEKMCKADCYVINTCAVTGKAEKKSRQILSRALKLNREAKFFVIGCDSQYDTEYYKGIKNLFFIGGTAAKNLVLQDSKSSNIVELPNKYESSGKYTAQQTRAFIKIQDGCDSFCSYCIIPSLRGKSRSRDIDSIIEEMSANKQTKEFVLTGINIADYGKDTNSNLAELLESTARFNVRIRLSSFDESLIDEDFVKRISKIDNLCNHFHLSLQSGCDSVLRRMKRNYTAEQYKNGVELLRKYFKNPSIATDIIIGFPEETDDEHRQSLEFCKQIGFSEMHIFRYSVRDGTPAALMEQVSKQDKKQRLEDFTKLKKAMQSAYRKQFIGTEVEVLTEQFDGSYTTGHTENYLKVYVEGQTQNNMLTKVKLIKLYKDGLIGQK